MAFSYSDENFTVVGNLCFVHIKTTTTGAKSISIPPALADRMLIDDYYIIAVSNIPDDTVPYGTGSSAFSQFLVQVKNKKIIFNPNNDIAYINFSFPINSNK